jgi:hypothetical protein
VGRGDGRRMPLRSARSLDRYLTFRKCVVFLSMHASVCMNASECAHVCAPQKWLIGLEMLGKPAML